jgi:hypothetical protein
MTFFMTPMSELSENCISILQNQLSNSSGCSELSWAEVMKTFEIDEWRILLIRKKTK